MNFFLSSRLGKSILLALPIIVLVLLFVVRFAVSSPVVSDGEGGTKGDVIVNGGKGMESDGGIPEGGDGAEGGRIITTPVRDWASEEAADSEVVRLNEILDTNNNDDILAQAEFLASSDSDVRRHSVLAALQWVGTPEAARLLIPLLNDPNDDISQEAYETLNSILDAFLFQISDDSETGELVTEDGLDVNDIYDVCKDALLNSANEDRCDDLMMRISALDVKIGLPIMVEVLENGQPWQKKMAAEYIDTMTNSDGVTNREEAIIWLQRDQAQQQH